jgi:hypothetical protein
MHSRLHTIDGGQIGPPVSASTSFPLRSPQRTLIRLSGPALLWGPTPKRHDDAGVDGSEAGPSASSRGPQSARLGAEPSLLPRAVARPPKNLSQTDTQ